MPLPSGWKASGMKACMPRVSSCKSLAEGEEVRDAVLERLDVPVEHRRLVRIPKPMRDCGETSRYSSAVALSCEMQARTSGWKISAPPPEVLHRRPAARQSQRRGRSSVRHPVVLGEEVDLHRREALEVQIGLDSRLEAAEELFVVGEQESRVEAVHDVDLASAGSSIRVSSSRHASSSDIVRCAPGAASSSLANEQKRHEATQTFVDLDAQVPG